MVCSPASMTRLFRSAPWTSGLRLGRTFFAASGMSMAICHWYQAALLLTTCTFQITSANPEVSSRTTSPAALYP
jgi:hypothetical protein